MLTNDSPLQLRTRIHASLTPAVVDSLWPVPNSQPAQCLTCWVLETAEPNESFAGMLHRSKALRTNRSVNSDRVDRTHSVYWFLADSAELCEVEDGPSRPTDKQPVPLRCQIGGAGV
ncbi:unnamed protein product [Boreogadus saida]